MNSKITFCEIIDSKKTKPRYLFYPSTSCLSPYLNDNNYSNINIIKQRRKNEKIKRINNQRNERNNLYENKTDSKLGKYNFNYNLDPQSINKEDIMENKFSKKYWNFNKTNEDKLKNIPNKEFDVLKNNYMNNMNKMNNINKKQDQIIESNNLNNNIEIENMNRPFINNILRNKNTNAEKEKYNIKNNDDLQNSNINKNELYNLYKNIKNENQNNQIISDKYNIPIIKDDRIGNKIDNNNNYLNIIIPQKEENNIKNVNIRNNKLLKNKFNIFYKGDGGAKAPIKKRKKSKKKSKK